MISSCCCSVSGRTLIGWALKWFRLCWTCSVVSWRRCCLRQQEASSSQVQSLRRRRTTAQTTRKKTSGVIQRRTRKVTGTASPRIRIVVKINPCVCVWFQRYCAGNTRPSCISETSSYFWEESYLPKPSSPRWRLLNGLKYCLTSQRRNAVQVPGPCSFGVFFPLLFKFWYAFFKLYFTLKHYTFFLGQIVKISCFFMSLNCD